MNMRNLCHEYKGYASLKKMANKATDLDQQFGISTLFDNVGENQQIFLTNHYFIVLSLWDIYFLHYTYGILHYKLMGTDCKH